MADCRTGQVHLRLSPTELAAWRTKAAAVGVPLSDQLRQAMARTRTWTAAADDVERERTSQVARIGNNLTCLGHLVVWVERQQIPKERITVTQ